MGEKNIPLDKPIYIIKRNGEKRKFDTAKIIDAISKSFKSLNKEPNLKELETISLHIREQALQATESHPLTVENIQDLVEISLIDLHYHDVLKNYILYRNKHQHMRHVLESFASVGYDMNLLNIIREIQLTFDQETYNLSLLFHKTKSFYKDSMSINEKIDILITSALELTSSDAPQWEYIASRFLSHKLHKEIEENLMKISLENSSFYERMKTFTHMGLYGSYLLDAYSIEDIHDLENYIKNERDHLFTYSSLTLLYKRYLIKTFDNDLIETPQEMFMGIAMHLGMKELTGRIQFVKDLYDILSTLKVTMATPTMSNARKPYHQLSSCFIDSVEDSLDGIYKSIDNFAKISKSGGGMGLYFGKVRANGSDIRGFKGVAGGVIRWIKIANDTAVAVDQLGVRQGSVAVYLDVWHKDIPEFLQMKTNNGDDRTKAHDVFPGICYPDLFWKLVKEDINAMWHLMCPHEIKTIKGYSLEDFYGKEWEDKYYDCVYDPRISKREIIIKDLVRLIIKSATETGTPFTFNRDIVNRANPNKHKGIIYSSNLCTEIMQNMKPISNISQEILQVDGENIVIERSIPGDFVVCNLASLVLGNIDPSKDEELEHIITLVVRALDNVIDLNYYPLPYAKLTNQAYRAIGLGVSGYHHMLVNQNIRWESEEHLHFIDMYFEKINYYTIKASMEIAKEKGSYPYFKGSSWEDGSYFVQKGYTNSSWSTLAREVKKHGLRNGYLLAIAPTGSTSIIAGTTAGTDPIMKKYFLEEKKGDIMPRVAPNLTPSTYWLYKSAHTIDQHWSIRATGIRQKHIDQSQSFNLYITTEHTMRQILTMFLDAWENGVKSIYYIRSKSLEIEECESCSS